MTPEDILLFSDIFKDPNPKATAHKLNSLSQKEKVAFARSCYELVSKLLGSILEKSINVTFQKVFTSVGNLFFAKIPEVNYRIKSDPEKWNGMLNRLRQINLFSGTSDFDLLSIAEHIKEIELKADEAFLSQYEHVEGVYFVKNPVNVYEHHSKIASVTRNGIFGDAPCITGELESSITAKPTMDCDSLFLSREDFVRLLRSVPGLHEKVFQDVVDRARLGGVRAEEQRRLIQEILDNIGQGSFSIDMAGEIGENYTAIAAEYLGVDNLAGVPFADLAFRRERKTLRNYYRALHMLFSGNQIDNAMILDLLPKEIVIKNRIFKLHYSFMQDGTGNVMSVFIRMEDLTLERELAQKEAEEKNILTKMQQNIGGFMNMLSDAENTFSLIERFAEEYWDANIQPNTDYTNDILRNLHGTKGLSGQFELNKLKQVIHELEDWFLLIDKEGMEKHSDKFIELLQLLEGQYQFAVSFKENLGEGIIQILNGISFSKDEFTQLSESVKTGDLETAKKLILSRNSVVAKRIISNWKKDTKRLAEKLNKKVRFTTEIDEKLTVPKEMAKTLNVALGHLYRNCIDHGIEPPENRIEKGKDETGLIFVKIFMEDAQLLIKVGDDGAGLDYEKIEAIARNNENIDQQCVDQYIADNEQWRILFLPGFSSAETITDVSGRGVGMDAVQNALMKMQGSIIMDTEPDKGSTFNIRIPIALN